MTTKGKPADSINILERIQSKIEEKMTRADTSNGMMAYRNALDTGKKSSTSVGGPRRCPNLQRLIEKKKQEEGTETATEKMQKSSKGDMIMQLHAVRKGGSILATMDGEQMRAKTGELVQRNGNNAPTTHN